MTGQSQPDKMSDYKGRQGRLSTGCVAVNPQDPGFRSTVVQPSGKCLVLENPVAGSGGPPIAKEVVVCIKGFGKREILGEIRYWWFRWGRFIYRRRLLIAL